MVRLQEICIQRRCLQHMNIIFVTSYFIVDPWALLDCPLDKIPKSLKLCMYQVKKHTGPLGPASWVSSNHFIALPLNP